MEQSFVHLAHAAGWVVLVIFAFAVIGVYAAIRWIVNLVTGAERAVENGVHSVQGRFTHRDQ